MLGQDVWGGPVYPRACGGTRWAIARSTMAAGLSPRVRGNQPLSAESRWSERSIPARAGEPWDRGTIIGKWMVYPRACGGTARSCGSLGWTYGLSPRVRGNRCRRNPGQPRAGSIPARAGEPWGRYAGFAQCRVYPRACGGTCSAARGGVALGGLSPRVRGNRRQVFGWTLRRGSIPARAGEPCYPPTRKAMRAVYPRACGGTSLTWAV